MHWNLRWNLATSYPRKRYKHNFGILLGLRIDEKCEALQVSIVPCLISSFGPAFAVSGILQGIYSVLQFASPQIVNLLITFVESDDPGRFTRPAQFLQASARQKPVSKRLAHFFLSSSHHFALLFVLLPFMLSYAVLCYTMEAPMRGRLFCGTQS